MSSKAGRNEARKLLGNALNNIGVTLVLAALLQPAIAIVQQDRWPTWTVVVSSPIFLLAAIGLFATARRTVRELED